MQSGRLNLGGLTSSGTVRTEAGATVDLGRGSSSFERGATFSGSGQVLLAGNLTGTLVGSNFQLDYGRTVTGVFTLAGRMDWATGNLDGQMTVATGGVLNIIGSGTKLFSGVIRNGGLVVARSGNTIAGKIPPPGATISNLVGGIFEIQDGGGLSSSGNIDGIYGGIRVFQNDGLLRVVGNGYTNYGYIDTFVNSGTAEVQSGTLAVAGQLTNQGKVRVSLGGLVPGIGYSRMTVSGAFNIGGSLALAVVNGFVAKFGDEFQVLEYGSRTGSFTNITVTQPTGGLRFTPVYGSMALRMVAGVPTGSGQSNSFDLINASTTEFQLRLNGISGVTYRLQESSDLKLWNDLLVTNSPNGLLYFSDPITSNSVQRFYRTISP